MRMIDADELKEHAYPFPCAIGVEHAVTLRAINEAPTVDAVPVVRGKWIGMHYIDGILEGTNVDKCSICGHEVVIGDQRYYTMSNYCPSCGAKME